MEFVSPPHVSKCEVDSAQKAIYNGTILSYKNDHSVMGMSTGKQFVSSFLTSASSDFTFPPRMHKVSTQPNAHRSK